MTATPTLIELVRDRTTDDESLVPDAKIQAYLDHHGAESTTTETWKMAAADILDYLARDDIYEQYARGQIRVAKPQLHARANELRNDVVGEVGVSASSSTMTRGDYGTDDRDPEYQINRPPYTYGLGVLKTVKEEAGV